VRGYATLCVPLVIFDPIMFLYPQAPTSSAPAPVPTGGPPGPSGRATYRGGAAMPRPGMGGEGNVPADELARMSIGTGDASQAQRTRPRYEEYKTKPAWITDKRGKKNILIIV
jgi:hypothetical protein